MNFKPSPIFRVMGALLAGIVAMYIVAGASLRDVSGSPIVSKGEQADTPMQQLMKKVRLPKGLLASLNSSIRSPYDGYYTLSDSYESIIVDVPRAWSQIDSGKWTYGGKTLGRFIAASPDLASFYATGDTPGVFFGASSDLIPNDSLKTASGPLPASASSCSLNSIFSFDDPFNEGDYQYYTNCVSGAGNLIVFSGVAPSPGVAVTLRVSARTKADIEALARIMATYQVIGSVDEDNHHQPLGEVR